MILALHAYLVIFGRTSSINFGILDLLQEKNIQRSFLMRKHTQLGLCKLHDSYSFHKKYKRGLLLTQVEERTILKGANTQAFPDNYPRYLPTRNWRILEFWAKFLEFFVKILEFFLKILEFFSKPLSFFSKTLEFYNQDGLFSWNLEFYPSILSFYRNSMSLGGKFMLIVVITTKLVLFF